MKAYYVTDTEYEYGYLVYANTPSEAKSKGFGKDGLDMDDYIALRVRRIPDADQYEEILGDKDAWDSLEGQRLLRSLGWYGTESPTYCDVCGLAEFDIIPESKVSTWETGNLCAGCIAEARVVPGVVPGRKSNGE